MKAADANAPAADPDKAAIDKALNYLKAADANAPAADPDKAAIDKALDYLKPSDAKAPADAKLAAQVNELVAQLAAKDAAKRDEAEKKLVDLASAADIDEFLVKALDNPDPEVRARVARILEAPQWGEADHGLRVALRPEKREWKAGETPRLLAAISNTGDQSFIVFKHEILWEIQVDGQWYTWGLPIKEIPEAYELGLNGRFSDIEITLNSNQWMPKDGDKELALTPGRHIVRVAEPSGSVPDGKVKARPVSRAVVIDILPADAKPAAATDPEAAEIKTNSALVIVREKPGKDESIQDIDKIGITWSSKEPIKIRYKQRPGYVVGRSYTYHWFLDGKEFSSGRGGIDGGAWENEGESHLFVSPEMAACILAGTKLKVVADVEVFLTNVPNGHMWQPQNGDYHVLWTGQVVGQYPVEAGPGISGRPTPVDESVLPGSTLSAGEALNTPNRMVAVCDAVEDAVGLGQDRAGMAEYAQKFRMIERLDETAKTGQEVQVGYPVKGHSSPPERIVKKGERVIWMATAKPHDSGSKTVQWNGIKAVAYAPNDAGAGGAKAAASSEVASGAEKPVAPAPKAAEPAWGQVVKGLQVGIEPLQKSYRLGQPMPVKWAIRNTGDKDVAILWSTYYYSPVFFEIGEKGGKTSLRDDFWRSCWNQMPPPPQHAVLRPGMEASGTFELLAFLGEKAGSGVYTVAGVYAPENSGTAKGFLARPEWKDVVSDRIDSKTIEIEVLPAEANPAAAAKAAPAEVAAMADKPATGATVENSKGGAGAGTAEAHAGAATPARQVAGRGGRQNPPGAPDLGRADSATSPDQPRVSCGRLGQAVAGGPDSHYCGAL